MPKYLVNYKIVEEFDAVLEGDFDYHGICEAIENGHHSGHMDRSWIDRHLTVTGIKEV